jgi:hypothetical protein
MEEANGESVAITRQRKARTMTHGVSSLRR